MTARGFCAVAALSKYTQFLPQISRARMRKSRRIFSTSTPVPTTCSRWPPHSLGIFVNNNAHVEHAMRAVIQDAVIGLAAVAVRTGVLHQHVVVEVLLTIADEQAINQALSAFSSQYGMDVVAHQSPAKKYRV